MSALSANLDINQIVIKLDVKRVLQDHTHQMDLHAKYVKSERSRSLKVLLSAFLALVVTNPTHYILNV